MENSRDYLNLELEDGRKVRYEVIGTFNIDENLYIGLLNEEDDVYIYKYEEINDEELNLLNIESDEEFERAVDEFYNIFYEEGEENE